MLRDSRHLLVPLVLLIQLSCTRTMTSDATSSARGITKSAFGKLADSTPVDLYTLRNKTTGATLQTTDPGRALVWPAVFTAAASVLAPPGSSRGLVRAALAPAGIGQGNDSPDIPVPRELKRIDAAVAELRAGIERVLCPYRGEWSVDLDPGAPDSLVPHHVVRCAHRPHERIHRIHFENRRPLPNGRAREQGGPR